MSPLLVPLQQKLLRQLRGRLRRSTAQAANARFEVCTGGRGDSSELSVELAQSLEIARHQRDVLDPGKSPMTWLTAHGSPSTLAKACAHEPTRDSVGGRSWCGPRTRRGDGRHRAPAPEAQRSRARGRCRFPALRPIAASFLAARGAAPVSRSMRARPALECVRKRVSLRLSVPPAPSCEGMDCLAGLGTGQLVSQAERGFVEHVASFRPRIEPHRYSPPHLTDNQ